MSSEEESSSHKVSKKEYEEGILWLQSISLVLKGYEELQKYCEQLNSSLVDLRNRFNSLLEEKQQLEATNTLLNEEMSSLRDELEGLRENKEEMEIELQNATADKEASTTRYEQVISNISQLEEEIYSLRNE